MKRSGIALVAASVVAACLVGTIALDAAGGARRRRPPRPVVSDVRIGDGGVVVTSEASPDVVVRFRLSARRRMSVPLRFEVGVDDDVNGHVDEDEFSSVVLDVDDPRGTSLPGSPKRRGNTARFEASPEGVEHVAVWRARADFLQGRHLAAVPELAWTRPDEFTFVPSTRPVLRISPRRGTADARAFEYDGNSAPVLTLESVEPGLATVLRGRAADADSEDLNGDGNLDPIDGEDRNGDGVLQAAPLDVRAWWVRVPADFDPSPLSPAELLGLGWRPCTWAWEANPPSVPGSYATPSGGPVIYRWGAEQDAPGEAGPFLVGMRVYDPQRSSSEFRVFPAPVVIPR